jgi:hypothetical protein
MTMLAKASSNLPETDAISNSEYMASHDCMIVINEMQELFPHLAGSTEDNHKTLLKIVGARGLNWEPPEYKPETLPFDVLFCFRLHNSWYRYTIRFFPCFGLMGHLQVHTTHNHLFLFLLLSLHWPLFTHWVCVVCMVWSDALCCETYWILNI